MIVNGTIQALQVYTLVVDGHIHVLYYSIKYSSLVDLMARFVLTMYTYMIRVHIPFASLIHVASRMPLYDICC
jgi:hypothetical protein